MEQDGISRSVRVKWNMVTGKGQSGGTVMAMPHGGDVSS